MMTDVCACFIILANISFMFQVFMYLFSVNVASHVMAINILQYLLEDFTYLHFLATI